jgi:hypothetical protein
MKQYARSIDVCPCPGTARSGDPVHNGAVEDPEEFVPAFSTASVMEGYLAQGRLEAEGIPVLMKGEAEGPYPAGGVDLWVPRSMRARARAILEQPPGDDDP